jgi:MHS family proline/betaine transporter-like MFS transporter
MLLNRLVAARATVRAVLSATAGTFLEFFDFISFAYFAIYIGQAFFPTSNPLSSLLLTFATFGVGFLMRPVGAIVIGAYADIKGRRPALVLSIMLMATGTLLVAVVPAYSSWGLISPILIVIARCMQGFSTGGEWGGAASFLVEYAPPNRRGFFGSLQPTSVNAGMLCGTLSGVILNALLSPQQMSSWGWRLPFLVGALIGPIGLYLRTRVGETPVFEKAHRSAPKRPAMLGHLLRQSSMTMLMIFGMTICFTVTAFTYQVYLPTFLVRELKFPLSTALLTTGISLAVSLVAVPLFGVLSDHFGRKPFMFGAAVLIGITAYPLFFLLVHYPSFASAVFVQIVAILLYSSYQAPLCVAFCELFRTHVRVSGLSIGYNLALATFGGFTPFVVAALIAAIGSPIVPAFYLIGASIISSCVLYRWHDGYRPGMDSLDFDDDLARGGGGA